MEGRGPWLTLVGGIDDATSRVTGATFRPAEDAAGYLPCSPVTAHRHGVPGAVYSDRHGIFVHEPARAPTPTEQLTGKRTFKHGPRGLSAPPQPALRRAGGGSEARLAAPAGGRQRRVGLLLHCIRAGSPTTPPSPGAASGSPSRERATGAAGPADRSSCRSGSTAACGVGQPRGRALPARSGATRSLGAPLPTALPGGRGQAGSAGQPHDTRVSRGSEGPTVGPCATACSGPPVASMSPPVQTESLADCRSESLAVDTWPHGACRRMTPRRMTLSSAPLGPCRLARVLGIQEPDHCVRLPMTRVAPETPTTAAMLRALSVA